jgi:hypothetical protein
MTFKAHTMHLAKLIKTASPGANLLALGSIILLIAKIFVFNRIPEIVLGAHELGILFDAILTSVVASYIFYLLVVHLKEQSDKGTVRPYIAKHAKRIVGDCEALLSELSKKSGTQVELITTKDKIESALKKIAPHSNAPLMISNLGRNANWPEFFSYRNTRTKESCRKLLDQLPLLDAQLIGLVAAIDDCSFFIQVQMFLGTQFNNSDMTFFTSSLHGYTDLCAKLDAFIKNSDLSNAP